MTTKFNVTKLIRNGNGGGGKLVLKPLVSEKDVLADMIELNMTTEQLEAFKEMGEFDVTIERAEG